MIVSYAVFFFADQMLPNPQGQKFRIFLFVRPGMSRFCHPEEQRDEGASSFFPEKDPSLREVMTLCACL